MTDGHAGIGRVMQYYRTYMPCSGHCPTLSRALPYPNEGDEKHVHAIRIDDTLSGAVKAEARRGTDRTSISHMPWA